MHPMVALAKKSIEEFITKGVILKAPESLSDEMKAKAGVFVSLKKRGQLRGCIGTFTPYQENVAMEIIRNSISAATQDPRFDRLTEDELEELDYSVDVLSPPERIQDETGLDPKVYGVIVISGHNRGLLLPDLEGVNSVSEQIKIAKIKAGIPEDEKIEIMRFKVIRYK